MGAPSHESFLLAVAAHSTVEAAPEPVPSLRELTGRRAGTTMQDAISKALGILELLERRQYTSIAPIVHAVRSLPILVEIIAEREIADLEWNKKRYAEADALPELLESVKEKAAEARISILNLLTGVTPVSVDHIRWYTSEALADALVTGGVDALCELLREDDIRVIETEDAPLVRAGGIDGTVQYLVAYFERRKITFTRADVERVTRLTWVDKEEDEGVGE